MKPITLRRVENVIRDKKINVKHFEVEYAGKEDKTTLVKVMKIEQINWPKVKSVNIIYQEGILVYKGYYEDFGQDYDNSGPILKVEDHYKIG